MSQKITPFLWFDNQAEDAVNFYTSVFKSSKIVSIQRYGDAVPARKGSVMTATLQIEGQEFVALNAGPQFKFNPAISFFVNCKTQEEVDELWGKLSDGGKEMQCGWITDKFGITWQIVPEAMGKLMSDPDPVKSQRVMQAMMKMVKLDTRLLQEAYDGK